MYSKKVITRVKKHMSITRKKKFKIISPPPTEGMEFRLYDFDTSDVTDDETKKRHFCIQMFGINEIGETCSLFVHDFEPFFFIKLPMQWTKGDLDSWYATFKKKMGFSSKDCVSCIMQEKDQLYQFTGVMKYHFAKLSFGNMSAFYNAKRIIVNEQGFQFPLYESEIPPMLRFFHIQNISPSGWVKVRDDLCETPSEPMTTTKHEFICSKDHLIPLPNKETPVPYKICSFDAEMSSSHGDFPVPIKDYKRPATQIIDALQKRMSKSKMKIDAVNLWLKKNITSMFGSGNVDVQNVFPKRKPNKEELKNMIEHMLKMPLNDQEKKSNTKINDIIYRAMAMENNNEDDTYETSTENKRANLKNMETIGSLVLDSECLRETKISYLNSVMTAVFPQLEGDQVTFVGSTFLRYGENEPYRNTCIVVGSCENVQGTDVISVDNERDCIIEWSRLIQDEDPDIIIGYNIFGFDYNFMFKRAQELDCINEFCCLSRNTDAYAYLIDKNTKEKTLKHSETRLTGQDYHLYYPPIIGRLQIDLLFYFRREYNMASYKLDDVAGTMIRDDIKGMEFMEKHTKLYSKNLSGLHKDDFIHLEITSYTTDYYADGKKFKVLDIEHNTIIQDHETIPDGKYNVIVIDGVHDSLDPKTQNLKWGMAKDDVTPQDIFRLSKENDKGRAIVAKYCVQDCNLVHHLMKKVDVLTGYIEMSRICNIPISFLVFRGQGIKLTSYVAKVCREKNTLMPDLEKKEDDEGYEGAIVLPPKCAMYGDNPVACNDYSSLYPSIAKGWNLSPDSKVWTKIYDMNKVLVKINDIELKTLNNKQREALERNIQTYDDVDGYKYIETTFDHFEKKIPYNAKGKPGKPVKTKVGTKVCRWAQFPNKQEGIIPCIIGDLLKARKETRVKAESEPDPFIANVLDKRQLGYKVTANSLYGQMGSSKSTFFEKDVAASITCIGRMMITYAKRMVEEIYGNSIYTSKDGENIRVARTKSQYVYGDSVASYTPICIRANDKIDIITIDEIANKYGNGMWTLCTEQGKQDKEFCELSNIQSWTEKGWTPLYRVIRHKLANHKKMVRVLTHTGMVDVTDDHSLLTPLGVEISPNNLKIGSELLHHVLPMQTNPTDISVDKARIMGFFMGDGSCGNYYCKSGNKTSWALNNASYERLQYYQTLCESTYSDYKWRCLQTMESSGVYKLVPKSQHYGSIVKLVKTYRNKLYNKDGAKVIPIEVMNGPIDVRQAFFDGLYDADGDKDQHGYVRIDQKNQISAAHICLLAQSLGWNTSINTRKDKPNVYRITMTKRTQRKNPNAIKKMHEIEYNDYVFDLTTENHHFAAGIGNMVVHNTDSVFFTFNLEDPETGEPIRGKEALKWTIEIAQEAAELCSLFLPPPMKLAYEKTLMSFILLSKKRYVGMLHEFDPNKGKLKFMGLSLKRRDSCDYVKDVYGGILTILMKEPDNIAKAIEFLNKSLSALINGEVSIEKLMLTKSLRSEYKNPNSIAHKVLAERIGEREPGNKPKPGDRIKFAFIENKGAKLLGDRVETPEYIKEQKLTLDYHYYVTNQLMNPLQQLFSLALDNIYRYKNKREKDIDELHKQLQKIEDNCYNKDGIFDLELFMKKRESYCSAIVKNLLFDPFLQEIFNKQNGLQTLMKFYEKRN